MLITFYHNFFYILKIIKTRKGNLHDERRWIIGVLGGKQLFHKIPSLINCIFEFIFGL
jgi:hypothetical protein